MKNFMKGAKIFFNQLKAGRVNITAIKRTIGVKKAEICPLPIYVQIEPTTRCNLRCLSCSRDSYPKDRLFCDMSFKNFKSIMSQIPSLCFIKFQGMGEPLLNKEIFDMVTYAKSKGIVTSTTTNSTLINKKNVRNVLIFDSITVSFDGGTKETYEKLRVGAKFENVLNNIRLLVNTSKNLNIDTRIIMNFVMSKDNFKELPIAVKLAKEIGIDRFTAVYTQQWTDSKSNTFNRVKKLQISNAQIEIKAATDICKNSKTQFLTSDLIEPNHNPKNCIYPFNSCFITCDGYVTPCCLRPDPLKYNFGNVFQKNFESIWNGEKYKKFRRCFLHGSISEICGNCPL